MNYYKYRKPIRIKKPSKWDKLWELLPAIIIGSIAGFVLGILYLMGKAQGIY